MKIIKKINSWTTFPVFQKKDKNNIALFASRRGGSTILSQLMASDATVREIDQPFDLFDSNSSTGMLKLKYLPDRKLSQFFNLNIDEEVQVERYMQKLLNAGSGFMRNTPLSKKNSRTLLKIVNAPFLLDYFSTKYDLKTVYLSRHPIPQALSVLRNKWGFTTEAYLDQPDFLLRYISEKQYELAVELHSGGTMLEKAVLNWVFENIYPLKLAENIDLSIKYEDLVLEPEIIAQQIIDTLELKVHINTLSMPSRSQIFSDSKTNQSILNGDKEYLLYKWQKSVDTSDRESTQKLLDAFEIDRYTA